MLQPIREDGSATVYYPSFMPFNLYFDNEDTINSRVNNLNNFYYWCSSRVLTLDRKYAKEILTVIGANQSYTDKDRATIAITYHCLSLTDVFWVKSKNENKSFSQISLFRHSLSKAFTDVSLRGKTITIQNTELLVSRDAAGDILATGVAPKAWIRENGEFYLLKDGDERDVKSEILASKIVDCFNINHVSYSPDVFEGTNVSKCKIITSEDVSIVSAEFIEVYCANREIDKISYILKKDAYSYYMMNIIDYLVGNTDRHWGNWGFLIDNRTNKPICLYPLMDFNKSFLEYSSEEGATCQTTDERISQKDAAIIAVKKVGLNNISDIKKDWFDDSSISKMFFRRLEILKSI